MTGSVAGARSGAPMVSHAAGAVTGLDVEALRDANGEEYAAVATEPERDSGE